MTNEARYYKADIQLRRVVQTVKKAGKHFVVVTDKDTVEADYVLSTLSVWRAEIARRQIRQPPARLAAGSGPGGHDGGENDQDFSCRCGQNSLPNAISHRTRFVTIYEQRHAWLLHLRTDGKPLVTIFASGAMVGSGGEIALRPTSKNQMLDLLDRVGEPDLSGARNNLEGRFHITDWTTNPNFLAAYSAMLPGVKTPQSAGDRQTWCSRARRLLQEPEEKPPVK